MSFYGHYSKYTYIHSSSVNHKSLWYIIARMVRLFPVKSMISINRNEICNNNEKSYCNNGHSGTTSSRSSIYSAETPDQMQNIPNRFNVKFDLLILEYAFSFFDGSTLHRNFSVLTSHLIHTVKFLIHPYFLLYFNSI